MRKVKVVTVFGTRPEAIKMAPVIRGLKRADDFETVVIVTGQHRELLNQVLVHFDLTPDHDLALMTPDQTPAEIITRALEGLYRIFSREKPDLVLVHGDTATTLAGSLAAYFNRITLGHVEAGLRTFDKYAPFPEEMMRALTDLVADLHFAPTHRNRDNLESTGCSPETIFVTGNTVIDALLQTVAPDYRFKHPVLKEIDFGSRRVLLAEAHRRENFGRPMEEICLGLRDAVRAHQDVLLVCSVHPNPEVKPVFERILAGEERTILCPPLEYPEWTNLMARAYMVLTDSGGLQEEAPSVDTPLLLLREKTERPEAVESGAVVCVGTARDAIFQKVDQLLRDQDEYVIMCRARNPFGDGKAAERIVAGIRYALGLSDYRPHEFVF